jgi:hypothetical protein
VVEAEEDIIISHQKIKVTVMMNMNMTTKTSTRTRKRPRILPFQNHQHQKQKLLPRTQQRHTTTTNTSMTRNLITMIPVVTTPMKVVKSIIVMNQTAKAVGEDGDFTVLEDDQEEVEQEEQEEEDVVDTIIIRRNILTVDQIVLYHPPKKITMQNTTTNRFRIIHRPRIRVIEKTPPFKKRIQSQTKDCKWLQQQSTMKITKRMEESSRKIRQQQSCNQSPIFQSKCYRFRRHLATRVGKEGDQ